MTLPSGAKQTYTYDNYHNVKTSTSDTGVKSSFTYDTYGNNTEVTLETSTLGIDSSSVYASDGNQVSSVTRTERVYILIRAKRQSVTIYTSYIIFLLYCSMEKTKKELYDE